MAYNTRSSARGATRPSTVVAGRKTHTGRKTATKAAPKRTLGGRTTKSAATATKKKAPATHHKRKPGIVDKIAGVVLKVEGAITGRPGVKVLFPQASKRGTRAQQANDLLRGIQAAGTKKLRGTDGKGSHRRTRSSI